MPKMYLVIWSLWLTVASNAQITLPIDFEATNISYEFTDFEGGVTSVIPNPQKSGINTSETVLRIVKIPGKYGGGGYLTMANAIDFSTNKIFKLKVFSAKMGARLILKVEGDGVMYENGAGVTKVNEWEELTIDFSGVSTTIQYNKIVFIFDINRLGDSTANSTYLLDDIRLVTSAVNQMNLPVTFDNQTVAYGLIGMEGLVSATIEADPTKAANMVGKMVKGPSSQPGAGATISVPGTPQPGFSNKIPFIAGNANITVRTWSPDAGIPVLLKAEVHADNTQSVETITHTTVAGEWENLTFHFANHSPGTSPIDYALNYNKLSIFFNFMGSNATEKAYYFDDLVFGSSPLPVKLLSFEAEKLNHTVKFAWTTTAEVNNKEFGVQRSETGEKWTDIGIVKGHVNSAGVHAYNAEDKMPLPGVNYYRLRQTDLDGASVYSKVKAIDFSGNATEALKVYPNPAKGRLNVFSSSFTGKVGYTILGADGRWAGSGVLQNTLSATGINISNLEPGIYLLKLQNEENTKTTRFIVQ